MFQKYEQTDGSGLLSQKQLTTEEVKHADIYYQMTHLQEEMNSRF